MTRRLLIGVVGAVIVIVAAGAFFLFRAPQEASAPIEAIPLATTAPAPAAAPAAEPTAAPAAEPTAAPASAAAPVLFEITQDGSEARFLIDEVLRGSPVTVVGTTNQVAGQLSIDPNDPTASQVGTIQINARTLATDNDFRNRAIKNAILRTDSFEFVTFTPTKITGLPTAGAVGESYTFQIEGDLTITDVTRPVTFEVTVTAVSNERVEGTATTEILYRDFNLTIPDSPAVDTVADSVKLELQFVALPASNPRASGG
jgi:polyisoprenoid-binding protein YceI